jgi:hypothetical protein
MPKISVQLCGGEQDGWREQVEVDVHPPTLLFVWRNADDAKMAKAKGDARQALASKLGVLAYRFAGVHQVPEGQEYVYNRWPQADKKMTKA